MIPAHKNELFATLFGQHASRRIRASFERFLVSGAPRLASILGAGPALIVSNHTSWWDGVVAMSLARTLGADGYALMDAKNLRRLPFFALTGGFGVDLVEPRDGARAIRYAANLLTRPGRLVWVFPRGEERPVTERPLAFKGGAAAIARRSPTAQVVPVGLRYEFASTERPDLYVSIGEPLAASGSLEDLTLAQERAVERELDRIDAALTRGAEAFADLHQRGEPGDDLATRALARLARAALPPGDRRPQS